LNRGLVHHLAKRTLGFGVATSWLGGVMSRATGMSRLGLGYGGGMAKVAGGQGHEDPGDEQYAVE
jgi:hypothetical protein